MLNCIDWYNKKYLTKKLFNYIRETFNNYNLIINLIIIFLL